MKKYEFTLTDEARDNIAGFLAALTSNPNITPDEHRAYTASYIRSLLPDELRTSLQEMSAGTAPLLVLHNLPTDAHIPTGKPVSDRLKEKGFVSERVLLAFSELFGADIIANPSEQGGALIHNVSPVIGKEHTRSSLGAEPLFLHTESPQEKNPPHFMMLLCLEGDSKASTMFFHIDKLNEKLSAEVIASLKKPIYEIHSGASYTEGAAKIVQPILEVDEKTGKTTMHFIRDETRVFGINDEAKAAFIALNAALEKSEKEDVIKVTLKEKGDAVIFNNGWAMGHIGGMMHGRGDKIENPHRWLQRGMCFIQSDESRAAKPAQLAADLAESLQRNSVVPFKVAAATLRENMLRSNGAQAYKASHLDASDAQAVLYGLEGRTGGESWVKRIAQESLSQKSQSRAS